MLEATLIKVGSFVDLPSETIQKIFVFSDRPDQATLEADINSGKISCVKHAVGLSNMMSDPSGSLNFISQNKNTLAWLHEWYKNSHEQSIVHTLKPLHLQPDLRCQLIKDYLDPSEEAMTQLAIAKLLDKVETSEDRVT